MEHVAAHHGDTIATEIIIPCMDVIDPQNHYIKLPTTPAEFYAFPKKYGWSVDSNFELKAETGQYSLDIFLQAWLFFGLIFTVVQENGKANLDFSKLTLDKYLSTRKLPEALKKWSDWESQEENRKGLRLRMIQSGYILDYARQVILKNCAYKNEKVWYVVDDTEDKCHITDEHVLVLMCLGEALSEVKAKIMKDNKVDMQGWHPVDDQHGWGPPRYIFTKMKAEGWCPRTIKLLKGQFSSNATMLLSAYYAYQKNSVRMTKKHVNEGCTQDECKVKSKDKRGGYQNMHVCQDGNCASFGPKQEDILSVLERNRIPLIRFVDPKDVTQGFNVVDYGCNENEQVEFVTVSHVWSDGWGNEDVNQLNRCQLQFIQKQILNVSKNPNTAFWMDTLVVPVGPGNRVKLAKKKAIGQILDVFGRSKWTIVIDNGLSAANPGLKTAEPAMKVLSSVWMRRLWTLQEAYLSDKVYFIFMEKSVHANSVRSLEDIEKKLKDAMSEPASGLSRIVLDQLSGIMMRSEQRKKIKNREDSRTASTSTKEATILVANAWRAARWRSTTRPEHETLALATILKLDTEVTGIAEAGLLGPNDVANDKAYQQKLVEIFWESVHRRHPGAIPSGLIFLPGEKINTSGYGWAPTTLLSADEIDYPDPMSAWNSRTELSSKGLLVNYPGFVLHTDYPSTRSKILGTSAISNSEGDEAIFSFPIDSTLNEWYSFTKADQKECPELTRLVQGSNNLAIILSRHPRELPREIALLVEVYGHMPSPDTADSSIDAQDYYVKVIHRVYIWRSATASRERERKALRESNFGPNFREDFPVAEMLGPRQRWWVDGYVRRSIGEGPLLPQEGVPTNTGGSGSASRWRSIMGAFLAVSGSSSSSAARNPQAQTEAPDGGMRSLVRTLTGF